MSQDLHARPPIARDVPRTWRPPPLPRRPTALHGTGLYDRPEHAEARSRLLAFVAGDAPVAVEVGFDHGMCLLDHARRWPGTRWLGLEIRKRRVAAVLPHAPASCLPFAGDARTILGAVLPPASVDRVDVLFPTPATDPRHVLFTPVFVEALARVLRPGGVVTVATDVEGLYTHVTTLFAGWSPAEAPERGPVPSRRERVCRRDGLWVGWRSWRPR